jgi:hypothetical protein
MAYRRMVELVYLTPNPLRARTAVATDHKLFALTETFKSDGIVRFDEDFSTLATELAEEFFESRESGDRELTSSNYKRYFAVDDHHQSGLAVWGEASFLHPKLFSFFTNPRLISLVSEYYGRQAYYRNLPVFTQTSVPDNYATDPTYKFHVDYGLRQVSLMMLLSDVTESDTHMQYALKSHLDRLPQSMVEDRFSYSDEIVEKKYSLLPLIGKRGTLFIFDAGNGLHRAFPKPNSHRRILHMNLTSGHYKLRQTKLGEPLRKAIAGLPAHVQRAFEKLA